MKFPINVSDRRLRSVLRENVVTDSKISKKNGKYQSLFCQKDFIEKNASSVFAKAEIHYNEEINSAVVYDPALERELVTMIYHQCPII